MKIVASKAVVGALATSRNKRARHLSKIATCTLCGKAEEDSYHALVTCDNAAHLWDCLGEEWTIPAKEEIGYTGDEWLLHLLSVHDADTRDKIIMLIWRIWSVRTDIVHGKVASPVQASRLFLSSYMQSLQIIKRKTTEEIIKGKFPLGSVQASKVSSAKHPDQPWPPPPANWVALSVDGSYSEADGKAGAGMVLRSSDGNIIFSSCRHLFHCSEALEAEIHAIMDGMSMALQWTALPVVVQSDSVLALSAMIDSSLSKSPYGHLVGEIKKLMEDREFVPAKIARSQNRVADCLANYGHTERSTTCWLH